MRYLMILLLAGGALLMQGCSHGAIAGDVSYRSDGRYDDGYYDGGYYRDYPPVVVRHRAPPVIIHHPGPPRHVVGPPHGRGRGPKRIPPGHMPPPGHARVWYPGVPPGHQPPPFRY